MQIHCLLPEPHLPVGSYPHRSPEEAAFDLSLLTLWTGFELHSAEEIFNTSLDAKIKHLHLLSIDSSHKCLFGD